MCHWSLCFYAEILHQDLSPGSIFIVDDHREENLKETLIDFDAAADLTEESETGVITGTRPFMAIGVLQRQRHTYRHDLESFLYVFTWTVITNHAHDPSEGSRLKRWSRSEWRELAQLRLRDMDQDFQNILQELPVEFHIIRPLAEKLRRILFPVRDGVVWTGTEGLPEAAYMLFGTIVDAFDSAIASIQASEAVQN